MKKLTSMILAVCMTATLFAGCSVSPANQPTETVPPSAQTTVPSTTEGKNFTVEITIPASAFEGQDMTDFDPRMYANDHGYLSAVLNEDGSVTVTMSHTRHLESLKELSEKIETQLSAFVEATGTPYIKEITHNEDFSQIEIRVDRGRYEHAFDLTPLGISMVVGAYQAFLNEDYHVEVTIVDADTGEEIDRSVYPRTR